MFSVPSSMHCNLMLPISTFHALQGIAFKQDVGDPLYLLYSSFYCSTNPLLDIKCKLFKTLGGAYILLLGLKVKLPRGRSWTEVTCVRYSNCVSLFLKKFVELLAILKF
jgi:hypothetical protein